MFGWLRNLENDKMARRIYFQSLIKWLTGVGAVGGTLIGSLFLYLVSIDAIEVTGHSGDIVCYGDEEDPCYAYINFTVKNKTVGADDIFIYKTNYDPWGRNTTFDFDPDVKSWKLQRSWGKGWRDIPLDKSCTGTWCGAPDNKGNYEYSVVFREGRDYRVRIVAYKNDPVENIKWSALDGRVDPIFLSAVDESLREDFFGNNITSRTNRIRHDNKNATIDMEYKKREMRFGYIVNDGYLIDYTGKSEWDLIAEFKIPVDVKLGLWGNYTKTLSNRNCIENPFTHRNGTFDFNASCTGGEYDVTEFGWRYYDAKEVREVSGMFRYVFNLSNFERGEKKLISLGVGKESLGRSGEYEYDLNLVEPGRSLEKARSDKVGIGIDPFVISSSDEFARWVANGSAIDEVYNNADIDNTEGDPTFTTATIGTTTVNVTDYDGNDAHRDSSVSESLFDCDEDNDGCSISFWVQADSNSSTSYIYAILNGGSTRMLSYLTSKGNFKCRAPDIESLEPDEPFGTNWMFIACSVNASQANHALWTNAVLNQTDTASFTGDPANNIYLGGCTACGSWLDGKIFCPRFFNSTLTQAQVDLLYNSGEPTCESLEDLEAEPSPSSDPPIGRPILNDRDNTFYGNLTDAIANASAGDRLIITNESDFSENINVNLNNISITANASVMPVITTTISGGFKISGHNVTITNISIDSTAGTGINVSSVNYTRINYVNVSTYSATNRSMGIFTDSANNLHIGYSNITATGDASHNDGIHLEASNNHNITHNFVESKGVHKNHPLHVQDSDFNTISNNVFNASGTGDRNVGVHYKDGADNNQIRFNYINTSGANEGWGIWYDNSDTNVDFRNIIHTADNNSGETIGAGIYVENSNNTVMDGNYITHDKYGGDASSSSGIWLDINSSNSTIIRNNITLEQDSTIGMYITGGWNSTITENNFTTIGSGLSHTINILREGDNNSIQFNNFVTKGNNTNGINRVGIAVTRYTTFRNNTFTHAAEHSALSDVFLLSQSEFVYFFNNTFTGIVDNDEGLVVAISNNSDFIGNVIKTNGSGSEGILISSTSNNNQFYNNLINTTEQYFAVSGSPTNQFFNRSVESQTNIVGGINVGGNFYANNSNPGTGFSETCTDSSPNNDICDSVYSFAGFTDNHPLAVPTASDADPCDCPSPAANWNVAANQCTLSTTCDLRTFDVIISTGSLTITSTGILISNHVWVEDATQGRFYVDSGGKWWKQ